MKVVLVAGLALLVAGCGNLSNIRAFSTDYVEPTSGDTARLRVITNGMVRGIPGSDCIDWRLPGAGVMAVAMPGFADHNNGRSLGMPPGPVFMLGTGLVRSELKVPGGQPFTVSFLGEGYSSAGVTHGCRQAVYFVPQAGHDYELILLDGGLCKVDLWRLDTEGALVEVPVERAGLCRASDLL